MFIQSVNPSNQLYAMSDIFPEDIVSDIISFDWDQASYRKLEIGDSKRRSFDGSQLPFDHKVHNYVINTVRPQIEKVCGVKFVDNKFWSVNWWLDEPGFKPRMHTDGDLPSALQVYFLPGDNTSLGTTFFNTSSYDDVIHRFPSIPNTGYLMLNAHHSTDDNRILLWHDMECAVPDSVKRVCLYVTLGGYVKL